MPTLTCLQCGFWAKRCNERGDEVWALKLGLSDACGSIRYDNLRQAYRVGAEAAIDILKAETGHDMYLEWLPMGKVIPIRKEWRQAPCESPVLWNLVLENHL